MGTFSKYLNTIQGNYKSGNISGTQPTTPTSTSTSNKYKNYINVISKYQPTPTPTLPPEPTRQPNFLQKIISTVKSKLPGGGQPQPIAPVQQPTPTSGFDLGSKTAGTSARLTPVAQQKASQSAETINKLSTPLKNILNLVGDIPIATVEGFFSGSKPPSYSSSDWIRLKEYFNPKEYFGGRVGKQIAADIRVAFPAYFPQAANFPGIGLTGKPYPIQTGPPGLNIPTALKTGATTTGISTGLNVLAGEPINKKEAVTSFGIGFAYGLLQPQPLKTAKKMEVKEAWNRLDHYGFSPKDSPEALKSKFRRVMLDIHPDKLPGGRLGSVEATAKAEAEVSQFNQDWTMVTSAKPPIQLPDILSWLKNLWPKKPLTGKELMNVPQGQETATIPPVVPKTPEPIAKAPVVAPETLKPIPGGVAKESVGIHLANGEEFAHLKGVTQEQFNFLKNETQNIPIKQGEKQIHLSQVKNLLSHDYKEITLDELRAKSPRIDELFKGFEKPQPKGVGGEGVTRSIGEAKVGEYVRIDSPSYGTKSAQEYNIGVPRQGKIVEITPKLVKVEAFGEIGEKKVYKFPLEAKISADLTSQLPQEKEGGLKLQQQIDEIINNPDLTNGQKEIQVAPLTKQLDKLGLPYRSPQEREVKPPEVKPVGKTPSRIAKSIEAKAIEQKLTQRFENIAGYDKITIKAQAEKASSLMQDLEKAKRVIRGEEALPEGLRGTALITATEEYIKETGDAKLAYELANSPLVSETSAAAQELRLAAEREQDSLTKKLQDLKKAKTEAVEKRTGKKAKEAVKNEIAKIKKEIKTPSKWEWGRFLEEIACK